MFGSMQDTASLSQFAQNPAVSQMKQVLLSNPQYMNQDTIIGFLLAGVGNVDLRRKTNYLIVDSKTTVKQIEEAFKEFTTREDVVIVMISQYEKLCKANTWQKAQPATDVVSLLSEIRIGTGKNDCWSGTKTANIPAVMAAAAAASGANFKLMEAFNLEMLSTGVVSATAKCNQAGEIVGMRRLYDSIGGIQADTSQGFGLGLSLQKLKSGVFTQQPQQQNDSFNEIMLTKFVRLLQQFVNIAEKGGEVDKSSFRETCSQAAALLLSNLASDSKSNMESFSQLLRLLSWCPAYISTPDAMETGIFIWTWLVSAAPQLGSLVLAELLDAWLWTIDTKRGLFALEVRYSGPAAKLRPHLAPGEPEMPPEKDPVEQILAHRLWLGFFIDRFENHS